MDKASEDERCPQCGMKAGRKYTAIPALFGWRLTDRCHDIGGPDVELERDI